MTAEKKHRRPAQQSLRTRVRATFPQAFRVYSVVRRGAAPMIPDLVERYCIGNGLEIGAGKTPYCDPRRTMFLDKNVGDKDSTENADIVADAHVIPMPDES